MWGHRGRWVELKSASIYSSNHIILSSFCKMKCKNTSSYWPVYFFLRQNEQSLKLQRLLIDHNCDGSSFISIGLQGSLWWRKWLAPEIYHTVGCGFESHPQRVLFAIIYATFRAVTHFLRICIYLL